MARKKTKKKVSKKSAIKDIEVQSSKEIVDKKETKDTQKKETKATKKRAVVTVPLTKDSVQRVFVKPKFNYLKAQGVK
jgi:hypothetical protein|tara:strand:+ start:269 stop:502 length:234 start_codon:yes stop_codon:yes gene_type:complete